VIKGISVLCIQKIKLEMIDNCSSVVIWGSNPCDFSHRPSIGSSRGIFVWIVQRWRCIISYNARGLGGSVKRKEVKELACDKGISVLCIQEIKLEMIDDCASVAIWVSNPCGFSYRPSIASS